MNRDRHCQVICSFRSNNENWGFIVTWAQIAERPRDHLDGRGDRVVSGKKLNDASIGNFESGCVHTIKVEAVRNVVDISRFRNAVEIDGLVPACATSDYKTFIRAGKPPLCTVEHEISAATTFF